MERKTIRAPRSLIEGVRRLSENDVFPSESEAWRYAALQLVNDPPSTEPPSPLTDDETHVVTACPYCNGSSEVRKRSGRQNVTIGDPDDPWVCYDCERSFDEPKRREPLDPSTTNKHRRELYAKYG